MIRRKLEIPPEHLFPPDEWRIVETRRSQDYFERAETVFSLSNGYLGIRGTFDEGRPSLRARARSSTASTRPGRSCTPRRPTAWRARARRSSTVPDATILALYVDDEPLFLPTARLRRYERVLDMRAGTLSARARMVARPPASTCTVRSCRLVSLEHRHVAAIDYEVVVRPGRAARDLPRRSLNRQDVAIRRRPRARRRSRSAPRRQLDRPRARSRCRPRADGRSCLGYRTAQQRDDARASASTTSSRRRRRYQTARPWPPTTRGAIVVTVDAAARRADPRRQVRRLPDVARRCRRASSLTRCERTLDRAVATASTPLLEPHSDDNLDHFWDRADVRVDSSRESVAGAAGDPLEPLPARPGHVAGRGAGVPAKGLTGRRLRRVTTSGTWRSTCSRSSLYTQPRIARNLLRFRHSMLPRARGARAELGQRGRDVPLAHDQRRGGVAVLPGRHRPVPHQRGHRLRDPALRRGTRRRGVPRRGRRRDPRRDRAPVGGPRLLRRRRRVPHPRRDRARRVHDGRQRQRLHEPDGAAEPLLRRRERPAARGRAPGGLHGARADLELGPEPRSTAWERAAAAMHVPYDERRGHPPAGRRFLDREVWDLEAHAAGELPAAAALPPARHLPPPGDQAGRHRAGDVPARQRVRRRAEEARTSTTTTAHDRRLVAVGVHPEHRRGRDRRRRRRARVLPTTPC